jgi:uncharacterized protein YfaP (DUF2135 family)
MTRSGGMLSKDISSGYGPEEYVIRNAIPGQYRIAVKMFSQIVNPFVNRVSHSACITACLQLSLFSVTVAVEVYTDCGRSDVEQRSVGVVRLDKAKQVVPVVDVTVADV